MTARRVGLTPTSWMTSSASGWTAPATSQNAAAETSPGTCSAIAGLLATGETLVGRPASASVSYPGFFAELERVRA